MVVMDSVCPSSRLRLVAWAMRALDWGRHVRTETRLLWVLEAAGGRIVRSERSSYSILGLECLLAVIEPAAS